jgi:hypothetical protein
VVVIDDNDDNIKPSTDAGNGDGGDACGEGWERGGLPAEDAVAAAAAGALLAAFFCFMM